VRAQSPNFEKGYATKCVNQLIGIASRKNNSQPLVHLLLNELTELVSVCVRGAGNSFEGSQCAPSPLLSLLQSNQFEDRESSVLTTLLRNKASLATTIDDLLKRIPTDRRHDCILTLLASMQAPSAPFEGDKENTPSHRLLKQAISHQDGKVAEKTREVLQLRIQQ
jgi:hypothetical protein